MKVNELRIGNLVQPSLNYKMAYGDYNPAFITMIGEHGFTVCNHYPGKWFEPILLTEEWLVMFGFIKTNSTYDNGLLSISLPSEDKLLWKNGRTYFNSWKILDAPQYVHQLQNLYFALTGQELVIKNK